ALALCCCTSLCVAAAGISERAVESPLVNDNMKITLTVTADDSSCTPPSPPPATVNTNDLTISTTVALKRTGETPGTTQTANGPSKAVKVPAGYSITLNTSRVVKCTEKGGSSDAAEKDCPLVGPETASTATNYITYVVTV
ncbi:hypothetical protein DQ04_26421000, partial [Trypanosoma grayi]|uniref:hypothetical protein n=1 Tax=Trypanosoma grayi TaxID=71804 RepID=UPI0004F3FA50